MPPLYSLMLAVRMLGGPPASEGSLLHVRLTTPVGSFASRPGARVEATLIAPVNAPKSAGGAVVFPAGSTLSGEVKSVRRVGLGLVHETASLDLEFDSIAAPDHETSPVSMRLIAVDNGREDVTPSGSIHEIRTTASVGNRAAHYIRAALLLSTHAQLAVWAVNSLVMQVPEPEIFLPTGAELTLMLTGPAWPAPAAHSGSTAVGLQAISPPKFSEHERADLDPIISSLPDRTEAPSSGRPSDLVNLAIIGSQSEVAAAFRAAGWSEARPISLRSRISSAVAVVEGRGSPNAPMTPLLLNDVPADMSWQKGFNDTAKRHHIRLWNQGKTPGGRDIWTGAATRDVDFAFLRPGGGFLTHEIARQVDRERDKVVGDLEFTTCTEAVDWWERADTPRLLKNATGDPMETDGRLAVVRLNRCELSNKATLADTLPVHGSRWQLILRRQILGFRSDMIRHNWYWRGYEGMRYLVVALQHKPAPDPDAAPVRTRASRLEPDWLTSVVSLR